MLRDTDVRPLATLPRRLHASYALLAWSDHDPPVDPGWLRDARRLGYPFAPYLGVAAVAGENVLAQVMVERRRFTTDAGREEISGISNVVTRHDALGHGLCRRLFAEVHRRERQAGVATAMLWTRRTWSAHRLYERLGYRDVYAHTLAVRRGPEGRKQPGVGRPDRAARPSDARVLDRLLAEATGDRIGFVPRFPRSYGIRFRLGWRTPGDHRILYRRGRPLAFYVTSAGPRYVTVPEAVLGARADGGELLDAIERFADGRWIAFGHSTIVDDLAGELSERGYERLAGSHATLMARAPGGPGGPRFRAIARTVRDRRFWCQRGDMF